MAFKKSKTNLSYGQWTVLETLVTPTNPLSYICYIHVSALYHTIFREPTPKFLLNSNKMRHNGRVYVVIKGKVKGKGKAIPLQAWTEL